MKHVVVALTVLTGLTTSAALGQTLSRAEKNEVFYTDKDGKKRVALMPMAPGQQRPRHPRPMPTGKLPEVYMIETEEGLRECSDLWRTTCQSSTYGVELRGRRWVVRRGGAWLICNGPEVTAECDPGTGTRKVDPFAPGFKLAPVRIH
jgi:hypothetical protein